MNVYSKLELEQRQERKKVIKMYAQEKKTLEMDGHRRLRILKGVTISGWSNPEPKRKIQI